MENFTNETIDTKQLPRFEEVTFTVLHKKYWNVVVINFSIFFTLLGIALILGLIFNDKIIENRTLFIILYVVVLVVSLFFSRLGFKKKGFAFRNHDVLYRSGVIATNTMVIPYNRVQHVALHEGFISRIFGLAKIEIFTAGGSSSDIEIPGIAKEEAENIKQLLMGKIQKQL
ncbi:MAG: PH domain-containing protein [Bacteroidota bacterium]